MVCGLLTLASAETFKNCQDHCLVTCNPVGITPRARPLRDPPCLHLLGMQAAFKTGFRADRACLSRKSPLHCSAHVGKTSSAPHCILGRTSLTPFPPECIRQKFSRTIRGCYLTSTSQTTLTTVNREESRAVGKLACRYFCLFNVIARAYQAPGKVNMGKAALWHCFQDRQRRISRHVPDASIVLQLFWKPLGTPRSIPPLCN